MRYWRHYPKFLQILLLMLMIFTLFSFSNVIVGLCLMPLFGVSAKDIVELGPSSPNNVIAAAQFFQAMVSLFSFLLSAFLFAQLCHPKPFAYLGFHPLHSKVLLPITCLLILAFIPLENQIAQWLQQIDLGGNAKAALLHEQSRMDIVLKGNSVRDLLLYLCIFAALPAIGEELLFRGVLMRFSYQNTYNIHFAIMMSAGLFGIAHGSLYNFLPIMLAGVLLGYIYYFSGSIWLSILAHFLHNAVSLLFHYWGNTKVIPESVSKMEQLPWFVLLVSAVLFTLFFFLLRKKATPLPADWADDFRGERQTN